MLKIKKIEKEGKKLYVYFKKPFYKSYLSVEKQLWQYYGVGYIDTFLDLSGKYIVVSYVLKDMEWNNND
jgi:hypothetical protein